MKIRYLKFIAGEKHLRVFYFPIKRKESLKEVKK